MPLIPVRNLAQFGVINDIDPYNIPPSAFSMAVNARFCDGGIQRAPVFRASTAVAKANPRNVSANTPINGFSTVIVGYLDGSVSSISSGVETDLSIAAYATNSSEAPFTTCRLGDVSYVNRADRTPWYQRPSDTIFQTLTNWDATWRAQILRAAGGALCAFGVTKGSNSYPTMVKTSEFAIVDTVPTSWDAADPTTNATENILAEMKSPITDANLLGETMMVYGSNETWTMRADGSKNVWSYHRLFADHGAINADCSVEVNRRHFVFGLYDIWKHDGVTPVSICDQRTKRFIFSALNIRQASRCFTVHNPTRKEITFGFVSGDAYIGFIGGTGCNRSAVYNYVTDVWSYDDLPCVFASTMANLDTRATYATTTATYSTIGGSYFDQEDSLKQVLVMLGDANVTYGLTARLYAVDQQGPGSTIALPVDTHATLGVTLERDGIDLDQLGVDLPGYKSVNSIYPQARLEPGASPLSFSFASADYFNQAVTFSTPQTYDGADLYKLDYNVSGRYLLMRMTHNDWHYFNITGLDMDLDVLGER